MASQCKLVLMAIETEISAALWAHMAREGLCFYRAAWNADAV